MIAASKPPIIYPDSDGKPMADNTLQWDWIVTIKLGIEDVFQNDPNVFIAGDLLWYPVEGELTCVAPDTMVAFGRPKGYRGSYKQWEEGDLAPQVVFEVLSESNTLQEMSAKCDFYREHGVEEYYEFDPYRPELKGWIRRGSEFRRIWTIQEGWTSPRLGVHFRVDGDLILTKPNGERFPNPDELNRQRAEAIQRAKESEERAETEWRRAEAEKQRAELAEGKLNDLATELARLKALLAERGDAT